MRKIIRANRPWGLSNSLPGRRSNNTIASGAK